LKPLKIQNPLLRHILQLSVKQLTESKLLHLYTIRLCISINTELHITPNPLCLGEAYNPKKVILTL
jgi:hypothetical protein